MTYKVFILEDHANMRAELVEFVSHLPGVEVCGEAESAEDALERLADVHPDLVLVDISLPRKNGLDFIREAKERWPGLLFLVLTGHDESVYMLRSFGEGAHGYVAKGNSDRLKEALISMLGGGGAPGAAGEGQAGQEKVTRLPRRPARAKLNRP